MERQTMYKIMQIQENVWKEPEFQTLASEHDTLNQRFLKVVGMLAPEQQAAVFDYVGLLIEMRNKVLEYVCSEQ